MPRVFWPSDFSGRNFRRFRPLVRLLCKSVPSGFGSPEAAQLADPATGSACMPNLHMFNGSNRLPHVRSIRFWSQGVANSHSFKRKKKQVVTHFFTLQKVRPQRPAWPAVTLVCLYVPGCIAWSSLTQCSTVVPSTFVKTWVKANLRGPSTMSPWLHGLTHCATCGIRKTGFQSSETWMCQDKGNVSFALNAMVLKQILMMVVHLHWKQHAAVYNLKFVGVSVSVPK